MELEVLHADNHVLALAKPAGVPVVPDASGDESLFDAARAWLERERAKPGAAWLGVVHRLDRPVSGVVVFACTSKAAARLSEQFRAKSVRKLYWGVGEDAPHGRSGTLTQLLVKDERPNRVREARPDEDGARPATTEWKAIRTHGLGDSRRTLLELVPLTGRPHQLRAAAAAIGSPLVGDLKYGARTALPDKSIALHARRLEIEHPTLRTPLVLECPPPQRPWWESWS
jgi:23S rRNA pseudouridine1911/1915/1917 synthase